MQKRKITKAVAVTLTTAMLVQPLEQTTFAAEAITTTTNARLILSIIRYGQSTG